MLILVVLSVGGVALWRRARRDRDDDATARWQAVSVNRPVEYVERELPAPLALLPHVEVEVRPAPGGKGTELRARPSSAQDPGELREALRDSKQLLEAGEILHGQEPKTSRRTILNWPMEQVERRAKKAGIL